jgi:phosphate transport system substrate-binding protein
MIRRRPPSIPGLAGCLAALSAAAALVSCGRGGKAGEDAARTIIQVRGSDTMVNVAQVWAEEYRDVAPAVEVEVSGGGSGVGLAALVKGAADIATASRDVKANEIEQARKNKGREPKDFVVGHDALALYVHPDNPLEELTLQQLAQIYVEGGKTSRWSDLGVRIPGAADDTIVRVSRQSSSGTYEFLRERVLDNLDFRLGSLDLNGSKEVVQLVSSTPTAIGYSGLGYATTGVKRLRLAARPGDPAIEASVATVTDKTYPLARSLHLYTLGEPQGEVKKYIDWILSDAGQTVVADSGFVPVPPEGRTRR